MASAFLALHRQDAIACQRAFDRVHQEYQFQLQRQRQQRNENETDDLLLNNTNYYSTASGMAATSIHLQPQSPVSVGAVHANQHNPFVGIGGDNTPAPAVAAVAGLNNNNNNNNNRDHHHLNNNNSGQSSNSNSPVTNFNNTARKPSSPTTMHMTINGATAAAAATTITTNPVTSNTAASGKKTIPNALLRKFFSYLGAVTAPESLEQILSQFGPENYSQDITIEDAMNLYAIWLRMVSVSEPPALELLNQGKVVQESSSTTTTTNMSNTNNNNNKNAVTRTTTAAGHQPSSPAASISEEKNSSKILSFYDWSDKIAAYLGNQSVMLLTISRTVFIMLFTLVHWFSVFFRDTDATLRCGKIGIGLDISHTVLITMDLFVEYYSGEYRKKVKQAIDERQQEAAKKLIAAQVQKQAAAVSASALAAAAAAAASPTSVAGTCLRNNNEDVLSATTATAAEGGNASPFSSSSIFLNPQSSENAFDGGNNNNHTLSSLLLVNNISNEHQSMMVNSSAAIQASVQLSWYQELGLILSIFFSSPKNALGLLSLLPLDIFLCLGDETVAATVLNHIRLLSVFRNYINPNPPTPVPLTALFADIYYFWMPLWMMLYSFIVFCSLLAIVFIIFRKNNPDPKAPQVDFLTSLHLSIQSTTTVGFGDVFFYGTAETWFAVVLVLVGMITNAAMIGSLVALIQLGNATLVRGDKIRETHAVLHYFNIPRLLQLEILGFQEHVLFSDVVSAFHSDTESFPSAMKDAMILQHRYDVLKQIEPFSRATSDELFFFAKELCTACFKPEEYLSCCSEPHHGIRILLFGLVDRLDSRGRYITTLRSGDCFGLDGILSGKDEEYNHKALAYCDLLVISYDDFHNILETMPKLRSWIVPALRDIERQLEEEMMERLRKATEEANNNNNKDENGNNNNNNGSKDIRNNNNAPGPTVISSSSSPLYGGNNNNNNNTFSTAKVLRSPVSMIDTTGGNLSMVHDLRSELRVFRRGLQTLAAAPALNGTSIGGGK